MHTEFIDDQTIDGLPDDPGLAFVMFERTCRANLLAATERTDNGGTITSLELDYMHDVVAAAQHFGIPEIQDTELPPVALGGHDFTKQLEAFYRKVRFFSVHHRLNAKATRDGHSVALLDPDKDRIRTLVAHLREAIDKSDLPPWRKERLRKRIYDFENALNERRLNLAAAMAFVAALGTAAAGVGEGADGISKLVHEISLAIGHSQEQQERINPPLLKQAPPRYLIAADFPVGTSGSITFNQEAPASFQRDEMDDEIPF